MVADWIWLSICCKSVFKSVLIWLCDARLAGATGPWLLLAIEFKTFCSSCCNCWLDAFGGTTAGGVTTGAGSGTAGGNTGGTAGGTAGYGGA